MADETTTNNEDGLTIEANAEVQSDTEGLTETAEGVIQIAGGLSIVSETAPSAQTAIGELNATADSTKVKFTEAAESLKAFAAEKEKIAAGGDTKKQSKKNGLNTQAMEDLIGQWNEVAPDVIPSLSATNISPIVEEARKISANKRNKETTQRHLTERDISQIKGETPDLFDFSTTYSATYKKRIEEQQSKKAEGLDFNNINTTIKELNESIENINAKVADLSKPVYVPFAFKTSESNIEKIKTTIADLSKPVYVPFAFKTSESNANATQKKKAKKPNTTVLSEPTDKKNSTDMSASNERTASQLIKIHAKLEENDVNTIKNTLSEIINADYTIHVHSVLNERSLKSAIKKYEQTSSQHNSSTASEANSTTDNLIETINKLNESITNLCSTIGQYNASIKESLHFTGDSVYNDVYKKTYDIIKTLIEELKNDPSKDPEEIAKTLAGIMKPLTGAAYIESINRKNTEEGKRETEAKIASRQAWTESTDFNTQFKIKHPELYKEQAEAELASRKAWTRATEQKTQFNEETVDIRKEGLINKNKLTSERARDLEESAVLKQVRAENIALKTQLEKDRADLYKEGLVNSNNLKSKRAQDLEVSTQLKQLRLENMKNGTGSGSVNYNSAILTVIQRYAQSLHGKGGIQGSIIRGGESVASKIGLGNAFSSKTALKDSEGNTLTDKKGKIQYKQDGINLGGIITSAIMKIGEKVIGIIRQYGKEAVQAFAEVETIKTNLGVVYGSQTLADSTFGDISQYAVKSPFGVAQMSEFAVLLKQSGTESVDLLDTLKMIGDVAGGNQEKFQRIANNYAQIVAAGKATSLDLRQFANAGLPIYKEIREELGVSQQEVRAMTQEGKITADVMEKVFKNMTGEGGAFFNAVEKGADTYKAKIQNFADIKQLSQAHAGEFIVNTTLNGILGDEPIFQRILDTITGIYSYTGDIFKEINTERNQQEQSEKEQRYDKLIAMLLAAQTDENKKMIEYALKGLNFDPDKYVQIMAQETLEQEQNLKEATVNLELIESFLRQTIDTLREKELPTGEKLFNEKGVWKNTGDEDSDGGYGVKLNASGDIVAAIQNAFKGEASGLLTASLKPFKEKVDTGDIAEAIKNYFQGVDAKRIDIVVGSDGEGAWDAFVNYIIKSLEKNGKILAAVNAQDSQGKFDTNTADPQKLNAYNTSKAMTYIETSRSTIAKRANSVDSYLSINGEIETYWRQTPAYQEQIEKDFQKLLETGREIASNQQTYGVTDKNFEWVAAALDGKNSNGDTINKADANKLFEIIEKSFTASSININPNTLINPENAATAKFTKETLLKNLKIGRLLSDISFNFGDASLGSNVRENAKETFDAYAEEINAALSGTMNEAAWNSVAESIKNLQEKTSELPLAVQKFFQLLVVSLEEELLDPKKIEDVAKGKKNEFLPFWKRVMSSVLSVPEEVVKELNGSRNILSYWAQGNLRNQSSSISSALLKSGTSFKDLRENVFVENGTTGKGSDATRIVNQRKTNENLKNIAWSLDSNSEVTSALAESYNSQISILQNLVTHGLHETEEGKYVVDEEAAAALGYKKGDVNAIVSSINAFAFTVDEKVTDAVDAYLEYLQEVKKNTETIAAAKKSIEDMKKASKEEKEESDIKYSSVGVALSTQGIDILEYSDSIKRIAEATGESQLAVTEALINPEKRNAFIEKYGDITVDTRTEEEKQLDATKENTNATERLINALNANTSALGGTPTETPNKSAEASEAQKSESKEVSEAQKSESKEKSASQETGGTTEAGNTEVVVIDDVKTTSDRAKEVSVEELVAGSSSIIEKIYQKALEAYQSSRLQNGLLTQEEEGIVKQNMINTMASSPYMSEEQKVKNEEYIRNLKAGSVSSKATDTVTFTDKLAQLIGRRDVTETFSGNTVKEQAVINRLQEVGLIDTNRQSMATYAASVLNTRDELAQSAEIKALAEQNARNEYDDFDTLNDEEKQQMINEQAKKIAAGQISATQIDALNKNGELTYRYGEEGVAQKQKDLALSIERGDIEGLSQTAEDLGRASDNAERLEKNLNDVGMQAAEIARTSITGGISSSFELMGKNVGEANSALKGMGDHWKNITANIMSSIGPLMTSAGLNIVTQADSKAEIMYGLLLAAAGGCASYLGGFLSAETEDDESEEDEEAHIQDLKDQLADLIDQAKTDAEYYENNLRHQNALSSNSLISERSVNDAIITPSGVINTHPDDYLIATKNPSALGGSGGSNVNITVNNTVSDKVKVQTEEKEDENGDIDLVATIVGIVNTGFSDGSFDEGLASYQQNQKGRSYAT